jgi:hypothetical protein
MRPIEAFLAALKSNGRAKISETDVWVAFRSTHGHLSRTEQRSRLLAALQELERQGQVALPKTRTRWTRGANPSLPCFIKLPQTRRVRQRAWRTYAWPPELDWVPTLTTLKEHEEQFLYSLDRYLKIGGFTNTAPLKYRSLQLTGDEKRLGKLLSGRLFDPGRLGVDLLRIETGPLPLVREPIRPGGRYLIVENEETFRIILAHLRNSQHPAFDAIALGNGRSLERSIAWLAHIPELTTSIHYLGDLDAAGLAIANATTRNALKAGLPRPQPASRLHGAMLEGAAELGRPLGWPTTKKRHDDLTGDQAQELTLFLAPQHRAKVARILLEGNRIPEETVAPLLGRGLALSESSLSTSSS